MEGEDFPFGQKLSSTDDPQPGDQVDTGRGRILRRVVSRNGSCIGYVTGSGLGDVKWCELLAWQLWCDTTI